MIRGRREFLTWATFFRDSGEKGVLKVGHLVPDDWNAAFFGSFVGFWQTSLRVSSTTSALSTFKVGVELYLYDGLEVRRTGKLSLDRALVRLSHFVRSPAFRRKFSLHPMNIQPIYRLKPGLQANLVQSN